MRGIPETDRKDHHEEALRTDGRRLPGGRNLGTQGPRRALKVARVSIPIHSNHENEGHTMKKFIEAYITAFDNYGDRYLPYSR